MTRGREMLTEDVGAEDFEVLRGLKFGEGSEALENVALLSLSFLVVGLHLKSYEHTSF